MLLGTINWVLLKVGSRPSGPRPTARDGPAAPEAQRPDSPATREARWPSPGFPQFFFVQRYFQSMVENNLHCSIMKVLYRFL